MVYQLASYQSLKPVAGLYYYAWRGRGRNSNACLLANALRGERPHVIIDPGYVKNDLMEPCFDDLAKAVMADGLSVEDIGLIINTHSHVDHCEANDSVIARSRVKAEKGRASEAIVAAYRIGGYRQRDGASPGKAPCSPPLVQLGEGVLELGKGGKVKLTVMHTPGHSPDSVALYWAERKVLFTGDTVLNGKLGKTDGPGADRSALRKSVERLGLLDVDILVPGHTTETGHLIQGAGLVRRNYEQARLMV